MSDNTEIDVLQEIRTSNTERLKRLQQQGNDLSPIPFVDTKINVLVDMLLHGPFRHLFELAYENQVSDLLSNIEATIERSKIIVPTPDVS